MAVSTGTGSPGLAVAGLERFGTVAGVERLVDGSRTSTRGTPVSGAPLAAWLHGTHGPLVVAVHGLAESSRYWNRVVDHLHATHRVLSIDLLGFGRSPWPDLGYTAAGHAEAVARTVRHAVGAEPALWMAHQAGVTVALHHAFRYPETVTGIVGLGTPWYRSDLEASRALRGPWWMSRWLVEHEGRARLLCRAVCGGKPVVPRLARVLAKEGTPDEVIQDVFLHHWTSLSETLRTCWIEARLPEHFGDFPVPFLALHGDEDVSVPIENLADAAPSRPWLSVERVSAGSFNLSLDQADVVADAVATLSSERRPGPRRARDHHEPAVPDSATLSVREAAALARAHRRTVHSWVESGAVDAVTVGNRLEVDRCSLLAHLFGPGADVAVMLRQPWLTAAEVAARLGVSTSTVQRGRESGLESHRVGSRRVYLGDEVDAWWAARNGSR